MVHHYRRTRIGLTILLVGMLLGLCTSGVLADDPSVTIIDIVVTAYVGVPLIAATTADNITSTTATLHGYITSVGGSNVTCRGFEWGYATGNYSVSWNETGTFEAGAFSHTIGSLLPGLRVYWRAFAVNAQGRGNSTEMNFLTVTLPSAPTGFEITQIEGTTAYNMTWVMGDNANTTIIRAKQSGYPTSVTDGYLVYSGNGTTTIVTGINTDLYSYYYCAWSQNEYGYSTDYARAYVGHPIGLSGIIFAVGLCGLAVWKRDWIRILLSICVVMWGAFALPYDIRVAASLGTLGAILLIMGIARQFTARGEPQA